MPTTSPLQRTVLLLFLGFLVFGALFFAKPFLVPLSFAAMFASLFYPLGKWLEAKGVGRGFSALLCVLLFVLLVSGIIALLAWQGSGMASEMTGMQQKLTDQIESLQLKLQNAFGVSKEKQAQFIKKQQESSGGGGGISTVISGFFSGLSGFLVDTILVLVYTFLLLYFRLHLRKFVLKVVPATQHQKANKIIFDSSNVSRKYFIGLGKMTVILWVMYGIGFSIVGVKNAILFAILCGLLEIVPFIGNLAGTSLTILASVAQGGNNLVLGILITYGLVQFIQTYILEPIVVGSEQNINPLFAIIIIVVGEMVWGVPGMVLALPLLGIAKVLFDNIEPLKPYGFLVGEEKKNNGEGFMSKIKKVFT